VTVRRLHLAGIFIMLAWITSLGWLVRRQYYSGGYPPGVTTSDRLAPGSRFYAVFAGGAQIGTASLTADTMPGGARITQRLDIGLRDSLESQLQTVILTPALAVHDWSASITSGDTPLSVTGGRDSTGVFRATLSVAGRPVRTVVLEPGPALPLFSAALRSSLNGVMMPGDTLTLRVLDPFSGAISSVSMRSIPTRERMVVTDSARLDAASGQWVPALADTVDARLLIQIGSARPIWLWVDRQGFPLQAELPNGLVLRRTAFEIAHLNFRNGFGATAPLAPRHRPSAGLEDVPLPGDTAGTVFFPSPDSTIRNMLPAAYGRATNRADSVAGVARWIGQHVHRDERGDDAARTIVEGRGSPLGRARLFVAALRGSGIPARLAVGAVRSGDHWSAQFLPQAYVDRWLAADLDRGGLTPDSADHTILTTRTSGLRFEYNALLAPLGKPTP
jgi:hypothetical protein